MTLGLVGSFATAILLVSSPALPDPVIDEPLAQDLIHSDVPLFETADENVWPQHFEDTDGSFGCTSRVAFGDWRLSRGDEIDGWWRIANYGVFHCALTTRRSFERDRLDKESSRLSFAVKLGTVGQNENRLELWALQIGTVPGSDYVLLSRRPDESTIRSFSVLQRDCPTKFVRAGPAMDSFRTTYCAINSKSELIGLAKAMSDRQPIGRLEWIGDLPAQPD